MPNLMLTHTVAVVAALVRWAGRSFARPSGELMGKDNLKSPKNERRNVAYTTTSPVQKRAGYRSATATLVKADDPLGFNPNRKSTESILTFLDGKTVKPVRFTPDGHPPAWWT